MKRFCLRGVVTKGSVGVCRGPTKKGVVERGELLEKGKNRPNPHFPTLHFQKKRDRGKGEAERGKKEKEEKEGGPLSFSSSSPPPHSEAAFESVAESPKNIQVKVQKLTCLLFFGGSLWNTWEIRLFSIILWRISVS